MELKNYLVDDVDIFSLYIFLQISLNFLLILSYILLTNVFSLATLLL